MERVCPTLPPKFRGFMVLGPVPFMAARRSNARVAPMRTSALPLGQLIGRDSDVWRMRLFAAATTSVQESTEDCAYNVACGTGHDSRIF